MSEQSWTRDRLLLVGAGAAVAALALWWVSTRSKRKGKQAGAKAGGPWQCLGGVDLGTLDAKAFVDKLAFYTPESIARAVAFRPGAGDVVTLTTPKTGQTWLLAILRALSLGVDGLSKRSDQALLAAGIGKNQSDGVPWLEHRASGAVDRPQPGSFRVFKSPCARAQVASRLPGAFPRSRAGTRSLARARAAFRPSHVRAGAPDAR